MAGTDFFDNVENYQPLRQGRPGGVVAQGILNPAQVRLENEEARSRLDRDVQTATDPLKAYVSYIAKLRSLYPSGHQAIDDALTQAIVCFQDRPEYRNDPRLLDIFIHVADKQRDPKETFRYMASKGIGSELPNFHLAMGAVFERAKDFATAERAYSEAVNVAKSRSGEDFKLAMLHFTHFKRRMARHLQDSRALHGPSSPEAARALKNAAAARGMAPLAPRSVAPTAQPVRGLGPQGLRTTAKRPQFNVFTDAENQQHSKQSGVKPKWDHLETEQTAYENRVRAQPWTSAGPVTQKSSVSMRQPSFQVYQEQPTPSVPSRSTASMNQLSSVKPAPFTVYSDEPSTSEVAGTADGQPFEVWNDEEAEEEELKKGMSTLHLGESSAHQEPLSHQHSRTAVRQQGMPSTVASVAARAATPSQTISTPPSNDRGDATINTRQALDDVFEMFAGSPSMSAVRQRQQPLTVARSMYTPAAWNNAGRGLAATNTANRPQQQPHPQHNQHFDTQDDASVLEEVQNVSPNVMFPNSVAATDRRRRPAPASLVRPALQTIENHEANASPEFLRMARNPPRPVERFQIARDDGGDGHDNERSNEGDITGDTFGISSVLTAFDRVPPSNGRGGFEVYRD